MTALENRLALNRFLCREFGYPNMRSMLEAVRDIEAGWNEHGESFFIRALYPQPAGEIPPERLASYDRAISETGRSLRMTPEHGRVWKPHQWLALLFTEHYLRRYFESPGRLRKDLNRSKDGMVLPDPMPDYTEDELGAVALQSATGSGKTLIMHANILQYRRIAGEAGRRPRNIILVTPNEHLSRQHERELRASNLAARIFSPEAGASLHRPVEIIDVNKLAEKKGVKRVAVSDFGDNNLVLVDEGHLGSSGKAWRKRRKELAAGGFTFEYSATFNQIVGRDEKLRNAYGKSLLFDYPYRAFHADGYGKDYDIANLPGGAQDENSRMYLLGALLSFYRQRRIWREGRAEWVDFHVARPLWVFLGKTVVGSSKDANRTRSDVVTILEFLGWTLARGTEVRRMMSRLLAGESGLTEADGSDYFAGRFADIEDMGADALYDEICATLFHGAGRLHVRYLTQGGGEMHLRTADHEPFGVVNIGDPAGLHRLLQERGNPDLVVEREPGFARRLFPEVDRADSPVNVVIGARRFIAGWNSWRVSTMGLMHVGVGEGPEIIQMFGRGVRLKGWNMSLKRHQHAPGAPGAGDGLTELETLRIFGLKADYMQTFRDLLDRDGIPAETREIPLPVTWNFARKELKILRLDEGLEYERSAERPVLPEPGRPDSPRAERDLHSRLQTLGAQDGKRGEGSAPRRLKRRHTAFLDRARLYERLLERKRREGWHNLAIDREAVDALLDRDDWYDLHVPPGRLEPKSFAEVLRLEEVVFELIADYAGQFQRKRRSAWECDQVELRKLDESDFNAIRSYRFQVDARDENLINAIRGMKDHLRDGPFFQAGVGVLMRDALVYNPLLYKEEARKVVTVRPVPLNDGERKVVEDLTRLAENKDPCLRGRELCLIRNLSRGRGVSFFDDHSYYPDFIVWLSGEADQHILFLDPKGLSRFGRSERRKVRLHAEIKDIEARLRRDDPRIRLHAYVISVTPPEAIGFSGALRSQGEWEDDGVYFLEDDSWAPRLLAHALASPCP